MEATELLPYVVVFAVAFALGWGLAWLLARSQRPDDDGQRAAAEATARSEAERRREAESAAEALRERLAEADRRVAVAEERAERSREVAEEQARFRETARGELAAAFEALAARALEGSSNRLLELAEQRLGRAREAATSDLDARKAEIESLLGPLGKALEELGATTGEIERARIDAYARIDRQVRLLAEAAAALDERTTSLATALSGPVARGRWGEMALANVVELAGMTAHCDFAKQATLAGGGRPDMIVRLPGGRAIPVDAKAPLAAYLEAAEATSAQRRDAALDRHARDVRGHVKALAARGYAEDVEGDVDLVVLFLPGDAFLSGALARDPELLEEALRQRVLLATPSSLVALLRTVALSWRERSLAENAKTIAAVARELWERAARFGEELDRVGRGLDAAVGAYNRAVGSFDRRLMPMARRLDELEASGGAKHALETPRAAETPRRRSAAEEAASPDDEAAGEPG